MLYTLHLTRFGEFRIVDLLLLVILLCKTIFTVNVCIVIL